MPKQTDPYTRGQQVYAATRALIAEGGIEAVTVRAVAARTGIASSSLRNQYRDKDERANALLWLAIAGNAVRHLGVPGGAQEIEAQRLALLVEAALAAVCDPVQAVDRSRAIELLRLHAHQLLWLAHATGARTA